MAGHRDDGTFAEDKAHHPNRKVHREAFIEPDQANPLGMVRPETNAIPDAHDPGDLGEMNHDARVSKPFNIFDTDALEAEANRQSQYWSKMGINPSEMADLQERAEREGW